MKLKSVKIHNYKCFVDLDEIAIDESVTMIVGKNDSGKSAILEATSSINPHHLSNTFFSSTNYPLHATTEENRKAISFTFILDSELLSKIQDQFYIYPFKKNEITFYKMFDDQLYYLDDQTLKSETDIATDYCKKLNIKVTIENFEDLKKYLQKNESEFYYSQDFKNSRELLNSGVIKPNQITKLLFSIGITVPECLLLRNNYTLNSIDVTQNERDIAWLINDEPENIISNLIGSYLNRSLLLENVPQDERIDKLNSILPRIEKKLNILIQDNWPINYDYRFSLHANQVSKQNKSMLNIKLSINVSDSIIGSNIIISQKSDGYRYFIITCFLLTIISDLYASDIIILLDEPGNHLHPSAQEKLMLFMNNLCKTKSNIQIVYTTHSPFMINKERIDNIRVVSNEGKMKKISSDLFDNDNLSLLPLSDALGYNLSQSLNVSTYYLLVEGYSDFIYINTFNREVETNKRISQKLLILPFSGIGNSEFFYRLLDHNHLIPVIVIDNNQNDKIQKYKKIVGDKEKRLILYKDIKTNSNVCDVEDLLGMKNYAQLLVKVYPKLEKLKEELSKYDNFQDFKQFIASISKQNNYDFKGHLEPAEYLRDNGFDSIDFPEPELIKENFAKLFKLINDAIQ